MRQILIVFMLFTTSPFVQASNLKDVAKEFDLALFYLPFCPTSIKVGAVIQELQDEYDFRVFGISPVDETIQNFTFNLPGKELFEHYDVDRIPTLFLMNRKSKTYLLVSNKDVSKQQLVAFLEKVPVTKAQH